MTLKNIERALRIVNAIDKRKQLGQMDDAADAALADAEAELSAASGRLVLAAYRSVRDSGVFLHDPTPRPAQILGDRIADKGRFAESARGARQ